MFYLRYLYLFTILVSNAISISDDVHVFHTYTTCGAGTGFPSGAPEFYPGFSEVHFARSLVFCVVFCTSFLPSVFFPLYCLSFDFRLLVTPLASSNFTYINRSIILMVILFWDVPFFNSETKPVHKVCFIFARGSRGRDRMLIGFTTNCAISAHLHENSKFEPRSWRGVLDTTLCDKVCQ